LINQALPVLNQEMSIEEAQQTWAKAFFEEKYGDIVRVVSIKNTDNTQEIISVELCGWTHVTNTRDIWAFVIINQEAVASGIKRITAYTWPKVIEKLQESKILLSQIAEKLWVKAENQISDKLDKEVKEKEELESQFESIKTKLIIENLKSADSKSNDTFDKIINISENSVLKDLSFKDIIFQSKWIFTGLNIAVYNQDWWFAILTPKEDSSAKTIAQDLWLKWGWSDMIVQWKDSKILELF
jgi:alanyl-tRNA synthetase